METCTAEKCILNDTIMLCNRPARFGYPHGAPMTRCAEHKIPGDFSKRVPPVPLFVDDRGMLKHRQPSPAKPTRDEGTVAVGETVSCFFCGLTIPELNDQLRAECECHIHSLLHQQLVAESDTGPYQAPLDHSSQETLWY